MYTSFIKILLNHIIVIAVFSLLTAIITKTAYGAQISSDTVAPPPVPSPTNLSNQKNGFTDTMTAKAKNHYKSSPERHVSQRVLDKIEQRRAVLLTVNIQKKFAAINNRLQKIANRIANRLSKMNKRGYDTSALQSELDTIFADLKEINEKISHLDKTYINQIFTGNTVTQNWIKLKTNLKSIKTDLISIKNKMRTIVHKMKTATTTEIDRRKVRN